MRTSIFQPPESAQMNLPISNGMSIRGNSMRGKGENIHLKSPVKNLGYAFQRNWKNIPRRMEKGHLFWMSTEEQKKKRIQTISLFVPQNFHTFYPESPRVPSTKNSHNSIINSIYCEINRENGNLAFDRGKSDEKKICDWKYIEQAI